LIGNWIGIGGGETGLTCVSVNQVAVFYFKSFSNCPTLNGLRVGIKVEREASQLFVTRYHLRAPDYYKKIDPGKFVTAENNPSVMKK
jgi:hypothetical protein